MGNKKLSYLEAFNQLQTISEKIKDEKIAIENLPDEIKKAKSLVKYCQELLKNVEQELVENTSEEE